MFQEPMTYYMQELVNETPIVETTTEKTPPPSSPDMTPSDPLLLKVPIAADLESDGSEVDFHMTLEDMEMLEAQLRALSTPPPPLGTLNEEEPNDDEPTEEEEKKTQEGEEESAEVPT